MSSDQSEGSDAEDGSESSFELPDALATGREKRQTAGNRLRDMLNAEIESEAIFAEDEDDADFGSDQDQQDDHDSELDSSSEEDENVAEAEDAGERDLKLQEKEAARARRRKAAEAFGKSNTINRAASRPTSLGKASKPTKRPRPVDVRPSAKRQSSRAHAVEIAADVEKRLEQDATKRAKMTRATKSEDRALTQEERLAEAKITEEANVASLNKIVKYEEEKKANQKLLAARRRAIGPLIRFVSSSRSRTSILPKFAEAEKETKTTDPYQDDKEPPSLAHPMDQLAIETNQKQETRQEQSAIPKADQLDLPVQPAEPCYSQFITFENLIDDSPFNLGNARGILLGNDAHLTKKYPAKPLCMLSGLPARYRDPETGINYGNQRAYTMLQDAKTGSVPWNNQLRLYVPRP